LEGFAERYRIEVGAEQVGGGGVWISCRHDNIIQMRK
jgi:hypothetical protein